MKLSVSKLHSLRGKMVVTRTSCTFLFQCPFLLSPSFQFIPFLTLPFPLFSELICTHSFPLLLLLILHM